LRPLHGMHFSNNNLTITEDDRNWVIDNFTWLRDTLGYPKKTTQAPLFTPEFFSKTFSTPDLEIENIVSDLCKLFDLRRDLIKVELITDIRDMQILPYEMGEDPFSTETRVRKGNHKLFIANTLLQHPAWLVHCLVCEFTKIALVEGDVPFEADGDDNDLFDYLAATYFGLGIILASSMHETGRNSDGQVETRWNYRARLPSPVLAFALAMYAGLTNDYNPRWKDHLNKDFRKLLESSLTYIKENVRDLYNEREAQASELFDEAQIHFNDGNLDAALASLQKVLFLSNDNNLKGIAFNNIGYFHSMKGDHRQAISNFEKAMALSPEFAYPVDNTGYSLVMLGELESALSYLQKAMRMDGNDDAYSYRNMALYHYKKNDRALAEEFFNKSFDLRTPVDLLEYHYAEFLLDNGEIEKSKTFFLKSVAKNQERGIARARELGLIS
jgi:tetratricopeptide (TPR) repeat protein